MAIKDYKVLPGRVEACVKALAANGWSRSKAANELHENVGTVQRLIAEARRLGFVIQPDPDESKATASKRGRPLGGGVPDSGLTKKELLRESGDSYLESQIAVTEQEIDDAHVQYGGKVTIFLARKNFSAARALIDKAEMDAAKGNDNLDPLPDIPLVAMLDLRIANALEDNFEAIWLKDLQSITVEKLLLCKNVGSKSIDAILQAVIKKAIERDELRALAESQLKMAKQV